MKWKTEKCIFTNAEMMVLEAVTEGMSSKKIAGHLGITAKTVEVHRHNILTKSQYPNMISLVVALMREGILK